MKRVLVIFGTRPEAIKMCPVVLELRKHSDLDTKVCVTGQHREMLDQVLDVFQVKADYDLKVMHERQTLFDITTMILERIKPVLEQEHPDVVLVHGDTSTTFATALACFYCRFRLDMLKRVFVLMISMLPIRKSSIAGRSAS